MGDSSIQQAPLDLEDGSTPQAKEPSEEAKRYRRCRTAPSSGHDNSSREGPGKCSSEEEGDSARRAKELFKEFRPSFKLVGLLLFVYLLVGIAIFYFVMNQISGKKTNRVLDAIYFSVVTMTSVGYGDLSPNSDTTKLLACAYVFVGMGIITFFISRAADYLVEKQEMLFFKALHMNNKGADAKMLRDMEANRIKYKFYTSALLLTVIIVSGTVFLWKVEKLSLVDSFYSVCATITTLGYVQQSFSSKLGRVFAIFWIIASTVIMAQFILYLAELYTEHRQKLLTEWVLKRRMTTMDLEAADLDGDREVG
jgi:potassium channel subfamily K, other eukaryote